MVGVVNAFESKSALWIIGAVLQFFRPAAFAATAAN
jgi:hypothetical protein